MLKIKVLILTEGTQLDHKLISSSTNQRGNGESSISKQSCCFCLLSWALCKVIINLCSVTPRMSVPSLNCLHYRLLPVKKEIFVPTVAKCFFKEVHRIVGVFSVLLQVLYLTFPFIYQGLSVDSFYRRFLNNQNSITVCAQDKIQMVLEGRWALWGYLVFHGITRYCMVAREGIAVRTWTERISSI